VDRNVERAAGTSAQEDDEMATETIRGGEEGVVQAQVEECDEARGLEAGEALAEDSREAQVAERGREARGEEEVAGGAGAGNARAREGGDETSETAKAGRMAPARKATGSGSRKGAAKTSPRKAPARKVTKKAPARKTAAKKAAKKAPARKTAAKKAPARKTASRAPASKAPKADAIE
jgi:hypothetical protein